MQEKKTQPERGERMKISLQITVVVSFDPDWTDLSMIQEELETHIADAGDPYASESFTVEKVVTSPLNR
jgi:hypothetical protein